MEYRHTQIGWIVIAAILAAIIFFLSVVDRGTPPMNPGIGALLLIAVLGLFHSLTVEVKEGVLSCRFGPGIIRRRFLLSEIEGARAVRNPWYAGWGIRWRPGRYVLWNVSGFQAVELALKGGNRFRIGTDEPEALVRAIQTNKAMSI